MIDKIGITKLQIVMTHESVAMDVHPAFIGHPYDPVRFAFAFAIIPTLPDAARPAC